MVNETLIKEVFSDEAFVNTVLDAETPEEVQGLLSGKGIDLTLEEIDQVRKALDKTSGDELNEDDLENVAGGIAITTIIGLIVGGISLAGSVVDKATRRRW